MNTDRRPHDRHGFTLLELMVAVSILAVLAMIALPSYQEQLRRARRSDGQVALLSIAVAQEKMRAHCPQYAATLTGTVSCDSGAAALGLSATSQEGYYRLSLSETSATGFTASAEPLGSQARDAVGSVACNPLTLDQDGQREPRACW